MQLFMAQCHHCHPGGAAGLGPALNNKPLPGAVMHLQIRKGMGAMPAFPEALLSEAQVDAIVAYLNKLQQEQ
jgi:mono/diheme cytochrome c family protein